MGARLAALALLLVGGLAALFLAARLIAALFAWQGATLSLVPQAWGPLVTAGLLVVAILSLAVLISLLPGRRHRMTWLPAERGGVLVSLDALERIAVQTCDRHPEVVRAHVDVRSGDGAPTGALRLWLRPLADGERIATEIRETTAIEVEALLGRPLSRFEVRPIVLGVDQLKRYLS